MDSHRSSPICISNKILEYTKEKPSNKEMFVYVNPVLGIWNLSILNKALLGKWSWRFMSEGEPLWNKVIIGKYGVEEGGRCSLEAREGYGVGLWKAIRKGWDAF